MEQNSIVKHAKNLIDEGFVDLRERLAKVENTSGLDQIEEGVHTLQDSIFPQLNQRPPLKKEVKEIWEKEHQSFQKELVNKRIVLSEC